MDDTTELLTKISVQLETIAKLLKRLLEQKAVFIPPDCEHL